MVAKKKFKRQPGTMFFSKKRNVKTGKFVKFKVLADGRTRIVGQFKEKK